MKSLYKDLVKSEQDQKVPTIIAYNRVDGPGSSLDLREFQQSLWRLHEIPENYQGDETATWSENFPRTVGITINTGTRIEALPLKNKNIGIYSLDYNKRVVGKPGSIPPIKENWLLKTIELFGIDGVLFKTENLKQNTLSSGLGGSATVCTGVCILANELAGKPFNNNQLISIASRMEQDLQISITGTQEQSNVVYGGVTDYVWFPWGIPGHSCSGYGDSIQFELISKNHYQILEDRMAIFHTGKQRLSSNVNSVWMNALYTKKGFKKHLEKLHYAYEFREGLRLQQWDRVLDSVKKYCEIRTSLSPDYIKGSEKLIEQADRNGCVAFPQGAGGGGAVLIITDNPLNLVQFKENISELYKEIKIKVKSKGHELYNCWGD